MMTYFKAVWSDFLLLHYQIIIHSDHLSFKIMDFILFIPAEWISFQSKKYLKVNKTISIWANKKQTKMHHGNV